MNALDEREAVFRDLVKMPLFKNEDVPVAVHAPENAAASLAPFLNGNVELAAQLKAFVPEGWTPAQMALRWILDHEEVSVVIPGASRPDQAIANLVPPTLPRLSEELHDRLHHFYATQVAAHIRGPY